MKLFFFLDFHEDLIFDSIALYYSLLFNVTEYIKKINIVIFSTISLVNLI